MELPQPNPNKVLIYRAGLIPYVIENGKIEMMFMKPSDPEFGGPEFQIAKGKCEPEDESFMDTALREAKEEIGLFIGNVIKTTEVGTFMGRTTVFVSKVKSKDMFGIPSDETGDVGWLNPEQFQDEGRILHKPVVSSAVRLIKKLENLD
jgi:8-oxo-dGTP pyrophosphatase MutT (NUDIX family)